MLDQRYVFECEKGKCVVVFYGDVNAPAAPYAMQAATAEHPRHACLEDHQVIQIEIGFAQSKRVSEIDRMFTEVRRTFEGCRWRMVNPIEGLPDTGSSIDHLSDDPRFKNESPVHGEFNSAKGFILMVERRGTKPVFSKKVLDGVLNIAKGIVRETVGVEAEFVRQ
jgi:hypothetical protein